MGVVGGIAKCKGELTRHTNGTLPKLVGFIFKYPTGTEPAESVWKGKVRSKKKRVIERILFKANESDFLLPGKPGSDSSRFPIGVTGNVRRTSQPCGEL